jgi:hypothetical protein
VFIPRYWSEASHQERVGERRHVTVRRFGWSSTSQADADVHARARVEEALAVLRAAGPEALGEFARREHRVAYAGSEGLPIREEIVAEHPDLDVVLTRNSYGAVCLNTRSALFVDVDQPAWPLLGAGCLGAFVGLALGYGVGHLVFGWKTGWALVIGLCTVGTAILVVQTWHLRRHPRFRDPFRWSVDRCREWCAARPEWRVAVYATPAGGRLLALHAPFDASTEAPFQFMQFVGVDPLYLRMCLLQKCFRARLTPKPWRIPLKERFRAGGTWPVTDPAKLARRAAWVRDYDEASRGFAACRFVEVIGAGPVDPRIGAVGRLHDDLSRARSDLPLA